MGEGLPKRFNHKYPLVTIGVQGEPFRLGPDTNSLMKELDLEQILWEIVGSRQLLCSRLGSDRLSKA